MKDAAALTPLAVIVLGLLREREMHAYEMMRLIRQRRDDRLVGGSTGTLYHTVARLERQELITEVGVDRDGNRPERTTYALTDAGRDAAAEWVRRELPRIDRILEFRVALSESHDLSRHETAALLLERRDALCTYAQDLRDSIVAAGERGVPFQFLVEIERESAILDADLAWLDGMLARLADESTPWGVSELPVETLERLDAFRESVVRW